MKYIDFESWIITWLHEGNVIVEDQLTHSGSRTEGRTIYKALVNLSPTYFAVLLHYLFKEHSCIISI